MCEFASVPPYVSWITLPHLLWSTHRFMVDGEEILRVDPGPGGFWDFGDFDRKQGYNNPWQGASRMAPFDQEVRFAPFDQEVRFAPFGQEVRLAPFDQVRLAPFDHEVSFLWACEVSSLWPGGAVSSCWQGEVTSLWPGGEVSSLRLGGEVSTLWSEGEVYWSSGEVKSSTYITMSMIHWRDVYPGYPKTRLGEAALVTDTGSAVHQFACCFQIILFLLLLSCISVEVYQRQQLLNESCGLIEVGIPEWRCIFYCPRRFSPWTILDCMRSRFGKWGLRACSDLSAWQPTNSQASFLI